MISEWQPDEHLLGPDWDTVPAEVQDRALALAVESILLLTNGRVGTPPITIRPDSLPACGWNPCSPGGNPSEFKIPGPVGYIDSLKIDGVEMDLHNGDWVLHNGDTLVWQGVGESPIPRTQDMNLPDTEIGTWSLTYSRSYPVGDDGRMAVAVLAKEFVAALNKNVSRQKCSLPRGVRSVTRMGVQFTLDAGLFPGGVTGNDIADVFILKWNPPGSPLRSASVFTPGQPVHRVESAIRSRHNGSL